MLSQPQVAFVYLDLFRGMSMALFFKLHEFLFKSQIQ